MTDQADQGETRAEGGGGRGRGHPKWLIVLEVLAIIATIVGTAVAIYETFGKKGGAVAGGVAAVGGCSKGIKAQHVECGDDGACDQFQTGGCGPDERETDPVARECTRDGASTVCYYDVACCRTTTSENGDAMAPTPRPTLRPTPRPTPPPSSPSLFAPTGWQSPAPPPQPCPMFGAPSWQFTMPPYGAFTMPPYPAPAPVNYGWYGGGWWSSYYLVLVFLAWAFWIWRAWSKWARASAQAAG